MYFQNGILFLPSWGWYFEVNIWLGIFSVVLWPPTYMYSYVFNSYVANASILQSGTVQFCTILVFPLGWSFDISWLFYVKDDHLDIRIPHTSQFWRKKNGIVHYSWKDCHGILNIMKNVTLANTGTNRKSKIRLKFRSHFLPKVFNAENLDYAHKLTWTIEK